MTTIKHNRREHGGNTEKNLCTLLNDFCGKTKYKKQKK
jgi:hypothetical protein